MQLSELYLNRYLYRDNNQNSETKDAAFTSADSSGSEPVSIPSGGAAQDINTGGVEIDGALIEPGSIPAEVLDVSNYGWGQTCVFSSTDLNTVSWGAGTFKSADGTTYSISAGNTGNMAAKTFIYLSLLDSETDYQITTTSATAVGLGKVLIAVAENAADKATFAMQEATQITGDNIVANTIDASKITTGQLIVGTNVGLGTAEDSAGVTTIVGNTVDTGYISALGIAVGTEVAIGTAFAAASAGNLATKDSVNATDGTVDATIISGGKIVTGLLTASNITTGTLSGITLSGNTIYVNGDALRVRDTSSNQVGYLYGVSSSVFKVIAATTSGGGGSITMELDASSGTIYSRATRFHPYSDNTSYLGGSTTASGGSLGSDKTWKYIGGQVIDAKDLYKLNDITVIDQSGTTIYVKSGGGGLVIQDDTTTIATFSSSGGLDIAAGKDLDSQYAHLDCVVFGNNSPLTENGTIYFNGSHFYGRISGAWVQLDN